MPDETYANIRQILGHLIGQRVVDITQHDPEDFVEGEGSFVMFLFENGDYAKFPVGDAGFDHSVDE